MHDRCNSGKDNHTLIGKAYNVVQLTYNDIQNNISPYVLSFHDYN